MENLVIKAVGSINMKDAELREAFKTQLSNGHPFVVALTEPKKSEKDGKTYFQLSIAQQVVSKTEVDELDKLLMGWGERISIERTFRNVSIEDFSKNTEAFIKEFTTLGSELKGRSLEITHSIVKPYDNATPINITDDNGEKNYLVADAGQMTTPVTFNKVLYPSVMTKGGELVYKSVQIRTGEPNHKKLTMTRVPESKFKGIQANLQLVDSLEVGEEANI